MIRRAASLFFRPASEWDRIEPERATIGGLFVGYVLPLAAIPPIAVLIDDLVFAPRLPGAAPRSSQPLVFISAALYYVFVLAMAYLMALVIDGLAPHFGACKNRIAAFKVAAYAGTAGWILAAFGAWPPLALIALAGAPLSAYLLYLGLKRVMKAPGDQVLGYTIMTMAVWIGFGVIVALALASVSAAIGVAAGLQPASSPSSRPATFGATKITGVKGLDGARLDAAAQQAQAALDAWRAAKPQGGAAPALAPEVLGALLPDHVGDFARTELNARRRSVGGMQGAQARAVYQDHAGDRLTLQVSDLPAAGGLAGFGEVIRGRRDRRWATGYETAGRIDGRLTLERFDRQSRSGEYAVMAGDRYLVQADGQGAPIETLKAAVASVRLQGLDPSGPTP